MKLHIVIDFSHIYYKYYFRLKSGYGNIKRLTAPVDWNGTVIEKDVSLIYYPMRDIENIRKQLELSGHDVTMSICFDMPSQRKNDETGSEYKSNRVHRLTDEDHKNIQFIEKTLNKAGHNTYRIEGYEADDLVNYLANTYADEYEYTIIYTNDKDLFVNINDKIGVMRYKTNTGEYSQVDKNSYERYLEPEFKTFIPYNLIGLYLSTVGDKSDNIKGIEKFGPKAFEKLLKNIDNKYHPDYTKCGDYTELSKIVDMCKEFLTEEQFVQLQESFSLVANVQVIDDLAVPNRKSTEELRKEAYMPMKMISLIP